MTTPNDRSENEAFFKLQFFIFINQFNVLGYSRANPDPYAKKKPVMNVIPQPPCCNDLIGTLACRRLRKNNLGVFLHRCEADPDFAMLQCCQTCGQQEVARRHANLFFDVSLFFYYWLVKLLNLQEENSKFCFDRHGHKFCETFMLKRDIWSPTSWSCSGENAQLAFRICRKVTNSY